MTRLGLDIGGTSVKAALVTGGRVTATAQSRAYEDPTPEDLSAALGTALRGLPEARITAVGLCLPGVFSADARSLTASVNLPRLVGVPIDAVLAAAWPGLPGPAVVTDAYAAAFDYQQRHGLRGRVLAVSLGTGVGACVLDDGVPLRVSPPDAGPSSGHLGQVDVSMAVDGDPPIGRDGGRGSLEAYIGAPALRARLGVTQGAPLPDLPAEDPAVRALVRGLRIAHAVYRPDVVVLLGGVARALVAAGPGIEAAVRDGLTRLARPGWRLCFGEDGFHAACGAARLASA